MMATMSTASPSDDAARAGQPDLFDLDNRFAADRAAEPRPRPPAAASGLADRELIERLPRAELSEAEALCAEAVSRSLVTAAPALERLWRRFAGFGVGTPLAEQLAVLDALARLDGEAARAALGRIVLSDGLPGSLLPAALRAAAEAGLALPAGFVAPLVGHPDAAVREPAFALADAARVSGDRLRDGLTDPSPSIRRSAAIAMGKRGCAEVRGALIAELGRDPTGETIAALAAIADDDVAVLLGRCAERHPGFLAPVLDLLREMESPRAARIALRLEAARPPPAG